MEEETKPRRISLRFTDKEFRALDNKRQSLGAKFQQIGEKLFLDYWLNRGNDTGEALQNKNNIEKSNELPSKEGTVPPFDNGKLVYYSTHDQELIDLLSAAQRVLESNDPIAGPALTTNIVAFDLLVLLHAEKLQGNEKPIQYSPDTQKRILRLAADAAKLRADFTRLREGYIRDLKGNDGDLPPSERRRA